VWYDYVVVKAAVHVLLVQRSQAFCTHIAVLVLTQLRLRFVDSQTVGERHTKAVKRCIMPHSRLKHILVNTGALLKALTEGKPREAGVFRNH